MRKRLLSMLLTVSMLLTLLPAVSLPVLATDSEDDASSYSALDALGIDTSQAPEGYDEDSTSNPYGKDTVTMNPVGEFYTVGLSNVTTSGIGPTYSPTEAETNDTATYTKQTSVAGDLNGTVYGQGICSAKTPTEIMESAADPDDQNCPTIQKTIQSGQTTRVATYKGSTVVTAAPNTLRSISTTNSTGVALSTVAAGNFDGNTNGEEAQAVMVYTSALSKNGGLYMKIGDITTGEYGAARTLISTTTNIGNPDAELDGQKVEAFDTAPYLLQNYLQVTTGDYDNDGKDEIAVYVPELGASRIEIYKLTTTSSGDDYKASTQWTLSWTYSLYETNYVSNMVSLVSGDFNQDGVDDLAATWGYYYGPSDNHASTAVVMFGASGNNKMLRTYQQFPLTYGTSDEIVRGAFTFGDMTGGGVDALILGGQLSSDISAGKYSRFVAVYSWDGTEFVQTQATDFDLYSEDDDGNLIYEDYLGGRTTDNEVFYSMPLCVTNLDVIGQGFGQNAKVYIDSILLTYSDDGLVLSGILDKSSQMQQDTSSPQYYVEYGGAATDLIGLGKETFLTMQQTLSKEIVNTYTQEVTTSIKYITYVPYYINWFYKLFGIVEGFYPVENEIVNSGTVSQDLPTYTPGSAYMVTMDCDTNYTHRSQTDFSVALCVANTDQDTTYLNYKGKHFVYSDPEILAVLASPPVFDDLLNRDDLSGNYAESNTSYSSSSGSEQGYDLSATISAGAYVSFEQDIQVFGVTVGSVQAEAQITASFTYEYEHSSSLNQTVSYSASAGEDMVAFYSIPLEVYEFRAYSPDGNGGYTEQISTVNIPHEACVQLISLDDYEAIAADYDILPQIEGNILTHTIGDPSTYPSSTDGYDVIEAYSGTPTAVGFSSADGGSTIGQEIEMGTTDTNSFTGTVAIEAKAGAGAGGFTVGVISGREAGAGYVTTTTSGSSFSGELQNMPQEAQEYGYAYNWKIFAYRYNNGTCDFPVVNYIVTDVTAPPALPTNFAQDVEATTSNSVTLTWSYDKTIAGFQLYRYYEFPDGSGSYELKFVPMTAGVQQEDGTYNFSYTDSGLSPYEDYQYQIQAVRATVPMNSICSPVLTARTKTVNGYPDIQLTGDGYHSDTNVLPIYPDVDATVTATVVNESDYKTSDDAKANLSYQWQALVDGNWTDLTGQKTKTLTFSNSGSADQGKYRCLINAIYYDADRGETYYISAYSDVFTAEYSKRTPTVATDTSTNPSTNRFTASVNGSTMALSLSLICADANCSIAPTGVVTFQIMGTDYYATTSAALSTDDVKQDDKLVGTATASVSNLSDGVYEVTAIYGGSRIFKSLTISDPLTALVGSSTGYQLNLTRSGDTSGKRTTTFTYGDSIIPALLQIDQSNTVQLENTVGYKLQDSSGAYMTDGEGHDLVYPYTDTLSIPTPAVGSYTLVAFEGLEERASRSFTVTPKDITVIAVDATAAAGSITAPVIDLAEGSTMAFEEVIGDLQLTYLAKNTAGTTITLTNGDAETEPTRPGEYTVTPIPGSESQLGNYSITYRSGLYEVTAQNYTVETVALPCKGTAAGTIALTNEGTAFAESTSLLFYASPYNGYEVDQWTVTTPAVTGAIFTQDGQNKFSYTMKSEPITVTVSFKEKDITLSVGVGGSKGGTVETPEYFTSGASVVPEAQLTFTATPAAGYHFYQWIKVANNTQTVLSGVTDPTTGVNTLNFTMGSYSTSLLAYFTRDSYTVNLGPNLTAYYMYNSGMIGAQDVKTYFSSGESRVGDTVITVEPRAGYSIPADTAWTVDGSEATTAEDGQSVSFALVGNTSVSVDTERGQFAVTTAAEHGSIAVTLDGTAAAEEDLAEVPGGTRIVAVATPDYGYTFDYWTVNGEVSTETTTTLTIAELGEATEIQAFFTPLSKHAVMVRTSNPTRADLYCTLVSPQGTKIMNDEEITSGDLIPVYEGDDLTIRVSPGEGFMVAKWTVGVNVYDTRANSYTLDNLTGDADVYVDLTSQMYYMVTYDSSVASATSDGIAFASGDQVGGGTKVVFTPSLGADEMVASWTNNDAAVMNPKYSDVPLVSATYEIDGLGGPAAVSATATTVQTYSVDLDTTNVTYTDSYDPYFNELVRAGAVGTYTFKAAAGYRIDDTELRGNKNNFDSVEYNSDTGTYTCVLKNIQENKTLTVSADQLYAVTCTKATGGTVSAVGSAIAGEIVQLTATASTNYAFDSATVTYTIPDTSQIVEVTLEDDLTFEMPAHDVTVTATFQPTRAASSGGGGGGSLVPYHISAYAGTGGSISPAGATVYAGDSKTFTITPDEGYEIASVLVDGEDVGAVAKYQFLDVATGHTIKATFQEIGTQQTGPQFGDVDPDSWYGGAVQNLSGMGLVTGTGDDQFSPNANLNRAMLVTILSRLNQLYPDVFGVSDGTPMDFDDVPDGTWYSDAVQWASGAGMASGVGDGRFNPLGDITREQLAVMLYHYAERIGLDTTSGADLSQFGDGDTSSTWANDALRWAVEAGILNGTDDNQLNPTGTATRAEAVVMLQRFIDLAQAAAENQ